jgi:hypothetical protein
VAIRQATLLKVRDGVMPGQGAKPRGWNKKTGCNASTRARAAAPPLEYSASC